MAEACSQAAMVARDHHPDTSIDGDTTMSESEAVYGELREPLSLCYAAADKVNIHPDTPYQHITICTR